MREKEREREREEKWIGICKRYKFCEENNIPLLRKTAKMATSNFVNFLFILWIFRMQNERLIRAENYEKSSADSMCNSQFVRQFTRSANNITILCIQDGSKFFSYKLREGVLGRYQFKKFLRTRKSFLPVTICSVMYVNFLVILKRKVYKL